MDTSVFFGLLLLLVPVGVTALVVSLYWRKRGAHVPAVAVGAVAGSIALGPALGGGLGWALEAAGLSRNADLPIGLMLGFITGFPIGAVAGGIFAGRAMARWADEPSVRRWALAGFASGPVVGWPVILLLPRSSMGVATAVYALFVVGVLLGAAGLALARSLRGRPKALRSAAALAATALVALIIGGVACGPSLRGRVLAVSQLEAAGDVAALQTVISDPFGSPYERQRASQVYAFLDPQAALKCPDEETRYRAATVLGERGDARVLPFLIRAATDPNALREPYTFGDRIDKARLIHALGSFREGGAVEAVGRLLSDQKPRLLAPYQPDLVLQAAIDAAGMQADARHARPLAAIAGSAGHRDRYRAAVAVAMVVLATGDRRSDAALASMARSKGIVEARRSAVLSRQYRYGARGGVAPQPSTGRNLPEPDAEAARRTPNAAEIVRTLRVVDLGLEELKKANDIAGMARLAEVDPMWRDSAIYALGETRSPSALAALTALSRSTDAATARLAGGALARARAAAALGHEAPVLPGSVRPRGRVARLSKAALIVQVQHRGITALALVVRDRAQAPQIGCLIVSRARYGDSSDRWGWGASWGGPPNAEYCRVNADHPRFGQWKYARMLPKTGPAIETLTVLTAPYDVRRGRLLIPGHGSGRGGARQLQLPAQASGSDLKWEAKPDACLARILDVLQARSPEVAALSKE
ncbi:MAG: HEAT repeat domain-containing protein [Armatimonadetes bacterium]|nr:HEAT repeat domain-containing protein [Armatimonadota bacterium]